MTEKQAQQLRNHLEAETNESVDLVETHISYVLLTARYAFKIKKPVHFSFLDFSTLPRRKHFCQRELELNRRLAADIYLDVVPVTQVNGRPGIQQDEGEIIDYAVKMKRMDSSRQMNLLLEKGDVTSYHMQQIADKLSAFHASTQVIKSKLDLQNLQDNFADLLQIKDFLETKLGKDDSSKIDELVTLSDIFIDEHKEHFQHRHQLGFTVDGHGDLHSKNIFLLDQPIIFDCIEFNDSFREVDVLDELAFFCLDLDFYEKENLESYFLQCYAARHPCFLNAEDHAVFLYYKLYRANIRLKIHTLQARQESTGATFNRQLDLVKSYLKLINRYSEQLREFVS